MNGDENVIMKWVYKKQSGEGYSEYRRPWIGVLSDMKRRYNEAWGDSQRERMQEKFMTVTECSGCHGKKLRPEALCVTVGGKDIWSLTQLSVSETSSLDSESNYLASRQIYYGESEFLYSQSVLQLTQSYMTQLQIANPANLLGHSVIIQKNPNKIIDKNVQKCFNIGYLFLQDIYYKLKFS